MFQVRVWDISSNRQEMKAAMKEHKGIYIDLESDFSHGLGGQAVTVKRVKMCIL